MRIPGAGSVPISKIIFSNITYGKAQFADRKLAPANSRIISRDGTFVDLGRGDLYALTCGDVLQAVKEGVGADASHLHSPESYRLRRKGCGRLGQPTNLRGDAAGRHCPRRDTCGALVVRRAGHDGRRVFLSTRVPQRDGASRLHESEAQSPDASD